MSGTFKEILKSKKRGIKSKVSKYKKPARIVKKYN